MECNEILRIERKKRNLSGKEVAEKLKIKPDTYYKYEQGKNEPDLKTLIDIADLYHVSLDYLSGRYKTEKD